MKTRSAWPFREKKNADSETISKIKRSLAALEEVHLQHKPILDSANQEIKNADITKVCKLEETIRTVKERFGSENIEELELDQPNPSGSTPLHVSTSLNYIEATKELLNHGANPNVQDAGGNSPLHTICTKRDIELATCIIEKSGRVLINKESEKPALAELFSGQDEEKVTKLMETIGQSNHRKEILEEILREKHILFRLVEEDKSEILSIVLKELTEAEQEEYVNLEKGGTTCLHIATLITKSIRCTSMLLEAGAKLKTNADGLLPKIEDFFTEENNDQITSALVDGLVERVETKQLDQEKAWELLVPGSILMILSLKERKIHFQRASGKNWGLIAQWEIRYSSFLKEKVDFSELVPRMRVDELEKMVEVARDGHLEKKQVNNLLCAEDKNGNIFLSGLHFNTQIEVAFWDQESTNEVAHKVSEEFQPWLINQANEGDWDKDKLTSAVCRKSSDRNPILPMFSEDIQKQLAVMNKEKTCQIAPWLGSALQGWLYQEALEGRWDKEMVFRVLKKVETREAHVVSSNLETLGRVFMKNIIHEQ